jgi:hypothetical protein
VEFPRGNIVDVVSEKLLRPSPIDNEPYFYPVLYAAGKSGSQYDSLTRRFHVAAWENWAESRGGGPIDEYTKNVSYTYSADIDCRAEKMDFMINVDSNDYDDGMASVTAYLSPSSGQLSLSRSPMATRLYNTYCAVSSDKSE